MTSHISVNYDANKGHMLVEGDINALFKDPSIAAFIRATGIQHREDSRITLPVDEAALPSKFRALTKLISRAGIQQEEDAEISSVLEEVRRNESRFAEFAARAEAIWHAQLETEEVREFATALANCCPGRVLYRLQLLAAYHLAFSQNACNFSVPGAGKTSIVYGAYAYLRSLNADNSKHVGRVMVVGPPSSFKAWEDEYYEVFGRRAAVKRIAGSTAPAERAAFLRGYDPKADDVELVLTTYQSLANSVNDFRIYLSALNRHTMMVLDEAHNIKRDDGVWAAAALNLAKYAISRVVLTGTPAPNGYEDLANLYKFIYPDRDIIGFSGSALKMMSQERMTASAVSELKRKIRPFYTRIRKTDLGLPPIQEEMRTYQMAGAQLEVYRYIEDLVVPALNRSGGAKTPEDFLANARLMRLRQAAANPSLLLTPLEEAIEGSVLPDAVRELSDSYIHGLVKRFNSSGIYGRSKLLQSLFQNELAHESRVLVWTYFLGNIPVIQEAASGLFDDVFVISGATPTGGIDDYEDDESSELLHTREAIIDAFHEGTARKLLIANPQAVGESISLHKACHVAIYYDRDFNGGRFIQSKDRIHRYGLRADQETRYIYLGAKNSVDEVIDARLRYKEQRLRELIDTEEIPLFTVAGSTGVSRGDISAIIEQYEKRHLLSE